MQSDEATCSHVCISCSSLRSEGKFHKGRDFCVLCSVSAASARVRGPGLAPQMLFELVSASESQSLAWEAGAGPNVFLGSTKG